MCFCLVNTPFGLHVFFLCYISSQIQCVFFVRFIHRHVVAPFATFSLMSVDRLDPFDLQLRPRGRRGCGSELRRRVAQRAGMNLRPCAYKVNGPVRPMRHGLRSYRRSHLFGHHKVYLEEGDLGFSSAALTRTRQKRGHLF